MRAVLVDMLSGMVVGKKSITSDHTCDVICERHMSSLEKLVTLTYSLIKSLMSCNEKFELLSLALNPSHSTINHGTVYT